MKQRMKILVLFLVLIVIAGIFIYKRTGENTVQSVNGNDTGIDGIAAEEAEPLAVKMVDLASLQSYGLPAMIDFGAESCGPCKEMAPVLEKLHDEWQGKAVIQFMDVWTYSEGLEDFPLQVIPTQFFFNENGNPFVPSDELQEEIGIIMYQKKDTGEHVFTAHQGVITEEQMRKIFAEMGVE